MTTRYPSGRSWKVWIAITALALPAGLLAAPPATGQVGCTAAAVSGLVSYWTANLNADDLLLCHNGALMNGAALAPGFLLNAFSFDGANDFVQVPDHPLWTLGAKDFRVSLWAKWNFLKADALGHPCCVFIGADEGGGNQNKWFFAWGGGVLNFHINSPALGPLFFIQAPFQPTLGQWYHLEADRKAGTYTIYVDGVAVGSQAHGAPIPDPNAPLTIGQAEGLGFFPGLIDEVLVLRFP